MERPFHVARSRLGNLPVYTDMRNGRSRVVTILRKYSGDAVALQSELELLVGSQVRAYHGRLELNGSHKALVCKWLADLGF